MCCVRGYALLWWWWWRAEMEITENGLVFGGNRSVPPTTDMYLVAMMNNAANCESMLAKIQAQCAAKLKGVCTTIHLYLLLFLSRFLSRCVVVC